MDYVRLGRTGMEVSVMGLGAGGPSRIGKSAGRPPDESVAIVRRARELGITFFDTAEAYRTEELLGEGLRDAPEDAVCISTKLTCRIDGRIKTPEEVEASLDASLKRLSRSCVDVYHLHGIVPEEYDEMRDRIYPVLTRMKEKGKLRFIGITEMFGQDSDHRMLSRALDDDLWDLIMVGFSVLNFSARPLLERTRRQGVGVLDMFAVRRALRDLPTVTERLAKLVEEGVLDGEALERARPFTHAIESGSAASVPELAYRFCRHEPGMDVVLSGTGSIEHLESNVRSMELPPLPAELIERIETVFGGIAAITGN